MRPLARAFAGGARSYGWRGVVGSDAGCQPLGEAGRIESYFIVSGTPMRSTQQLSITLPVELAKAVKAKVASGAYASESEVIREGLRALMERDRVVENWLRESVAPAYDALRADPARGIASDEVRARLDAEHKLKSG